MNRALDLAERGRGAVEPNPMVGAVIVRDGLVLGEGYHRQFGGPHAEVEALAAARAAGCDVVGATMYVTLEPCVPFANKKTPSCAARLIEEGLGRVVVAMLDQDPRVAGRGVKMLQQAGVSISIGLCGERAGRLLRGYVRQRSMGRPWVICKWAQSRDGYLAAPADRPRWISCEESRRAVHELRSWCDGIAVGIGTVLADDPALTNRSGSGGQPTRVVLDSDLRLPESCRLVESLDIAPLYVVTAAETLKSQPDAVAHFKDRGVEFVPVSLRADSDGVRRLDVSELLDILGRAGWNYLLIEGGPAVLADVLSRGLADELQVYVSPDEFGPDQPLPRFDIHDVDVGEFRASAPEPSGRDELLRFEK